MPTLDHRLASPPISRRTAFVSLPDSTLALPRAEHTFCYLSLPPPLRKPRHSLGRVQICAEVRLDRDVDHDAPSHAAPC